MTLRNPTPAGNDEKSALPAIDVVLVAFDGAEAIDVAGPASVFTKAEQLRPGTYRLHTASPMGGTVLTNAGLSLAGFCRLDALPSRIDTVIVAGGEEEGVRAAIVEHGVSVWLSKVAPGVRRVASVCSGAFALAASGLLDGRRATTHWRACDQLQAMRPRVQVERGLVYVRDGPVWTSAGVTTGIELALALVEDDIGRDVAMDIARTLALPLLRAGDQAQLSDTLQAQSVARHRLRDLMAWIGLHPGESLSVGALAERAHMSERQFARAFAAEAGTTPARFVEQARVATAARLLRETQWTQEKIASHSGFRSLDAFARAFRREHGVTPRIYRERA
ncbi:GlxA family transcriptional regulator [Hydrogenophaga sp. BPS33]|uniref:GlxA family transcriptional regulator n=1 Tax=Hydrogenophaga sp. BPS33 TaxID=2651974 RepID=UPI00131F7B14|nr:helix-turn-helix domain-containing protein [Hydrogenophaga sp. BPS33]QHE85225.1 helix-turn-helix domain-containing protein [Hydrogenophaga sp. BPS33]